MLLTDHETKWNEADDLEEQNQRLEKAMDRATEEQSVRPVFLRSRGIYGWVDRDLIRRPERDRT